MSDQPLIIEEQRILLVLQDPISNTVHLFAPRWEAKIVLDHPVTLEDVRETVTDPDFVYRFGGDRRYYRKNTKNVHLLCVTRDYRGYNSIVTIFPTDSIKDWPGAELLYVRPKPRPV